MIISDKHIFNLKKRGLKRKIKLDGVDAITKSKNKESDEFVLHVPSEYDYHYSSPKREQIIEILRELHQITHKKILPVYGVYPIHLKEFTTTKQDKKKNKYKMPAEQYLIKENEQKTALDASLPRGSSGTEADFDMSGKKRHSETIYQKDKGAKLVTLDEFKIIKLLGKGNFGKVYIIYIYIYIHIHI